MRAACFLDDIQQDISTLGIGVHGLVKELEMPTTRQSPLPSVVLLATHEGRFVLEALQNRFQLATRRPAYNIYVNGQAADGMEQEQQTRAALEYEIEIRLGQMPQQCQRVNALLQQKRVNRR